MATVATIKDVARRAGVSVASVSYTLNGKRRVGPDTEERIRSAIRELGYSPNASARNLAAGRSHILGVIVPDIRNPFFPEITTAFQESAALADMEAVVMSFQDDAQRSRLIFNRLFALQVPGAAVFTSQVPPAVRRELAEKGIQAVYMDHAPAEVGMSVIEIDYASGVAEALEHLYSLGHRRIGFIGGPEPMDSSIRRKGAFLNFAAHHGAVEAQSLAADNTARGGYFACSQLLHGFRATALLCGNDLMALGAMHYAHDHGIGVPEALSVVGFDDIFVAEFTQPPLTTVAVPRAEIGRAAFDLLAVMQANPSRLGQVHSVATRLVVRGSTAPPLLH